jgi:Flp pilus assembly protein TadG
MFEKLGSLSRVKRWLLQESEEARCAVRYVQPDLIVHYWDGSAPGGREIRDISESGAYIYTAEQWYPGTIIRIVFQTQRMKIVGDGPRTPEASICINSHVIRQGGDGVAVAFLYRDKDEQRNFQAFLEAIEITAQSVESPVAVSKRAGQALIEFALIMPLALLLAINAVNFGGFMFAWITVANAARDGAQYMIMSSASPGSPSAATSSQITSLITNDVTSLLNRSSIVVATCTNNSTSANGCTTLSDPEAPTYTLATVDVTYTYNPFIPLFSFPKLGISATLPTSTIHRKAVMRMMQ